MSKEELAIITRVAQGLHRLANDSLPHSYTEVQCYYKLEEYSIELMRIAQNGISDRAKH